jgi:hypothetical protein
LRIGPLTIAGAMFNGVLINAPTGVGVIR